MRTLALVASMAALAALAACGSYVPAGSLTGGYWHGADHYFASAYGDDEWRGHEEDVVRDQAARDLACPTASLQLERPYERAWVAQGCGRRATFLLVTVRIAAPTRRLSPERAVWPIWVRAIDLASPAPPPPLPEGLEATSDPLLDAEPWTALVAQGSKDLECPRDQITPDFVPQGRAPSLPIAEGCAKRATYVSGDGKLLRLSAVVPIR